MQIARRFKIRGRVQGVGYRYFTYEVSRRLRLLGNVRNLIDGSVEVYAIGSEETLLLLEQELYQGPFYAEVREIETEKAHIDDSVTSFSIIH